jgi:hypothetical protein
MRRYDLFSDGKDLMFSALKRNETLQDKHLILILKKQDNNQSCSAISFRVISIKLLLEINKSINSIFVSNILINNVLYIFPVRTIINFSGRELNRNDSKKSLSFVISIVR